MTPLCYTLVRSRIAFGHRVWPLSKELSDEADHHRGRAGSVRRFGRRRLRRRQQHQRHQEELSRLPVSTGLTSLVIRRVNVGSAVSTVGPPCVFTLLPPTSHTLSAGAVVRRTFILALLFALGMATLGCGSSRERGKNNDNDRPTTPKK